MTHDRPNRYAQPESIPRDVGKLRVAKTIPPSQAGAVKLARQYGDRLVCVRHRHDADNVHRYTTIELLVEHTPIQKRPDPLVKVAIAVGGGQDTLRAQAQRQGATWDQQTKLWTMHRSVATKLRLLDQVVSKTRQR